MSELILEPEQHIYTYDNRVVRHVTSILQDNFGIKPYWSEWHAQKGRAIHRAIQLYINDNLDWSTVDERIKSRIEAFQLFMSDTGYYNILATEMSLFSKRYQFAGTLDLWLDDLPANGSGNLIFDIKPPSPEPVVELQLAAYSLMLEEKIKRKVKGAAAVCLKDNGRYTLKWVENLRHSQRIFLACLTVSNWQRKNS